MKAYIAITLAAMCLFAGVMAQEPQEQIFSLAGQPFNSVDYAQLQPTDEGESEIRNKRQFGFGGGYGGGRRGFGGGYGRRGGFGGRGFGGGYGGGRGFGGGGYGR